MTESSANDKVGVIIPNYNKSAFLVECLESVINQTYDNIEVIIVDDCSTDDSVKIISKIIKKTGQNIKLYPLKKNHGVSYARNFGVSKTNAKYLTFLDSDDKYINPSKIANEVRIADENKIAFSQWVPADKDGKIKPYKKFRKNPYSSKFAISKILAISLPPAKQLRGYMISRKLFKKIGGYNDSLSLYEDFDLQCRLALHGKFVYTKEVGEAYRQGIGGLSSVTMHDWKERIENIRRQYLPYLDIAQKTMYRLLNKKVKG